MKVFISYSRKDGAFARKPARALEEEGLKVWPAEEVLEPGDNVALQIGKALEESKGFVVLVSPASMASKTVRAELNHALSSKRFKGRFVSVVVKPTARAPWILRRLPGVDARISGVTGTARHVAGTLCSASSTVAEGN